MQIHDSYISAGLLMEETNRNAFFAALVTYLATGDEPELLSGEASVVWTAIFPSLEVYRAKVKAGQNGGKKSGKVRKAKATNKKAEANVKANAKANKEAKAEAESEANGEAKGQPKDKDKVITNVITNPIAPYGEILDYLNEVCGTHYRIGEKTKSLIHARFSDGFELNDFKAVIDTKAADWLRDPKMAKYLRPETLFGTKFESYLNQPKAAKGGGLDERFGEYAAAF